MLNYSYFIPTFHHQIPTFFLLFLETIPTFFLLFHHRPLSSLLYKIPEHSIAHGDTVTYVKFLNFQTLVNFAVIIIKLEKRDFTIE